MRACRPKQKLPPLLLSVGLIFLVLSGCAEAPSRSFEHPPAVVAVTEAQQRPLIVSLEAIGTARANESVTITAKVTDTVSKVRFNDGDVVERGDVLVELTNEEESALLAEAEANVKDAQTQYDRLADLLAQRSVPVSQVDEASARLQAAIARQGSIEARLQDRLIRSPFNGLLGFRNVSQGTLLTATTPITTLDDISIIKLDFSVPEVHLGKLRIGQDVVALSDAFPTREFPATVRTIGSRIDATTRAAIVRAHIGNEDGALRPGMLLRVRVLLNQQVVLMVPETALQQRGDRVFVFLAEEGLARIQEIEIGTRQNGWVQVTQGLNEGDPVISEGVIKVRDNVPVRVLGQDGPARESPGRSDVAL